MNTTDILRIRLYNQLLAGNSFREPHEIVRYMGAMQSQAFDMAKWAIGARLPGCTAVRIDEAINSGQIVRTHILRPTWHFVSAEDIYWMIELSSPRLRPVYTSYGKMSGVDEEFVSRHFHLVEKLLDNEGHLTRQELLSRLIADGYQMETPQINRLIDYGEVEGVIGSGFVKGGKHSYCLMQKRIPKPAPLSKEEALERLARRFFTSHAPATLQDFIWWSGLLISDARKGLELIKDDFISEEINGRTFWMRNDTVIPPDATPSALLLPPFDEMVVSYKDRSEMIEDEHYGKVMTKNGLFSPTVMLDGKIIGSWRKVKKNKQATVELSFFHKTTKQLRDLYNLPTQRVKDF